MTKEQPAEPEYIPLEPKKIAALRKIQENAHKDEEKFLRQFIQEHGKQDDQHGCRYVSVFFYHPYNWDNHYVTAIVGMKGGKFFNWECEGLHESLPANENLHSYDCSAESALSDLNFAISWWKRGMLEERADKKADPIIHPADIRPIYMNNKCTASDTIYNELKAHKKILETQVADKMDAILTYVPTSDDEQYQSVAYHQIGQQTIICKKSRNSRNINVDEHSSYMVNSGTQPSPTGALSVILGAARKAEQAK